MTSAIGGDLFNFSKKQKKSNKQSAHESDFLLPQDKKTIEVFSQEKKRHLEEIKELNSKIENIQNSTGTLFPKAVRLHHLMRQKYRWYYEWHTKPYASITHWLILLIYIAALPLTYWYLNPRVETTQAIVASPQPPVATRQIKILAPGESYSYSTHNISGSPQTVTAGKPVTFTMYILNPGGYLDGVTTAAVTFSSSDSKATLPSSGVTEGRGQATFTFKTVGRQTVRATQTSLTDNLAPTGAIAIAPGSANDSPIVNLLLTANDPTSPFSSASGVGYMRFSNFSSGPFNAWIPVSQSYNGWDLTNALYGGNGSGGMKNVYVQFKDNAGNISGNFSTSKIYTPATPTPTPTPTPSVEVYEPKDNTFAFNATSFILKPEANFPAVISRVEAADTLSGQSSSFNVVAGDPARISLQNMPASLSALSVSQAVTIQLYDAFDNPTTVSSNKIIHLSTTSGTGEFSHNSDGPWSQGFLDMTIGAGSGSTAFHYRDRTAGTSTISASESPSEGWADTSGSITINATELTPTPTLNPSQPITNTTSSNPSSNTTTNPLISPGPSNGSSAINSLIPNVPESVVTTAKIANTLTPIAATATTLGFLPLLVQSFPSGFHVLAFLFPTIFATSTARRRRKPWGTVYDLTTDQPIELAIVRVFDYPSRKLVATKVTDQDGRFNFMLSKGHYYLHVTKPGFVFPPKISNLKAQQLASRFGPGSDTYFGRPFVIQNDSTNINFNIALEPELKNLPEVTQIKIWFKNALDWFFIAISYIVTPLMIVGSILAIFASFILPTRFNLWMSGIYVVLLVGFLITRRIQQTRLSLVFNSLNGKPIANATVSIIDKEYQAIRETKFTDSHGHFALLAPKGEYYLTIEAQGYVFPAKQTRTKDRKLGQLYFGETIQNHKTAFIHVGAPMDPIKNDKK